MPRLRGNGQGCGGGRQASQPGTVAPETGLLYSNDKKKVCIDYLGGIGSLIFSLLLLEEFMHGASWNWIAFFKRTEGVTELFMVELEGRMGTDFAQTLDCVDTHARNLVIKHV